MNRILLLPLLSLPLLSNPLASEPALEFEYRSVDIQGWTVLVEAELDAQADLRDPVLRLLETKLWEISARLPAPVVERLQQVPLRMHNDREGCPGGVYHPSSDWLREHKFPEEWARGVEFGNARNFLSWSRVQPAMVLHELAHAWHHQVLGYEDEGLLAEFALVRDAGTLENVLYVSGGKQRAYALNNVQEFFAEMSEAWWATNDYFPFVKAEVLESFPGAATLLERCWQLPK